MTEAQMVTMSPAALRAIEGPDKHVARMFARHLECDRPSRLLATAAGVERVSWGTPFLRAVAFRGQAIVTMADGSKWRCVGVDTPNRNGEIKMERIEELA